uniref:synaptopodin-2-like isoform X1 n=1 Tax=Oncorhynchus gorbuscha TaxID=8017 RepID=UPI001EAF31DB|nr:synaptopodin-2-like isoform X1 [Oncorhynchus gorbuscha]
MGTGDYICVTVHGGAPWGFSLREGEGDAYRRLQVYQVEEGGHASLAGICEGDEVVSLNGEPCGELSLPKANALIDASVDCLQLLVKRWHTLSPEDFHSETYFGTRESAGEALESTTLHILSPGRSQPPRELYIADSQDEAYYGETESDTEAPGGIHLVRTQLCVPAPEECQFPRGGGDKGREGPQGGSFSPGAIVELQLSLAEHTLEDPVCTSLGSALGIEGEIQAREALKNEALLHTTTHSLYVPGPAREPLSQHGVVLSSPSLLGQVEVTLQHPAAGRGSPRLVEGVVVYGASGSVGEAPGEEGGGKSQGAPASFTVSFGIPTEGAEPAAERDSDSEKDLEKPNKHRAKHARLRRSESLSDKQVKEAKSKCKRIAILLNAEAPNPNNKGVLMFKRHRQRAKKYTLVSYGTGESEPEYEVDDSDEEDARAIKFTLVATTSGSELEEDFITNAQGGGRVLTFDWDTGLLEIERKLNSGEEMEQLPNTTGKGATMFAQRRQRMDEIVGEHEEMRRQGIPVEGVQEVEKHAANQQMEERSYMQATTEKQAYMDFSVHQKQQQQYQKYQEQQYYEQQQQQQQQYEQQQYQQQQQQYEQQQYLQQQQYHQQQQQEYQQQHIQQYSSNMNGMANHQTNEMQSSMSNQTAQPFSLQNQMPALFSPPVSGSNQEMMGQGEQIASRDERISTPAIKSGILQDTRNRFKGKPMFNFKQAPKVSPNPELLNLLNRSDKKLDSESCTEEDYLSLGAEACNFLQSPRVKHKTPPPVAPKPIINPNSPPWSPQPELANQELPLHAENSVPAPAAALETESAPEPAPEPSPPFAPQEAPVPAKPPSPAKHTWSPPGSQAQQQQPQQAPAWGGNGPSPTQPHSQPEPQVSSWAPSLTQASQQPLVSTWPPAEMKHQALAPSKSPPQLPWVTPQPSPPQPQPSMNSWAIAPAQSQLQWVQPQEQQQPQAPWAQPQEQAQQHPQAPWAKQPQSPEQAWPQDQPQPPWVSSPQPPMNAWTPPQSHTQPQQPPWAQQAQPQHPAQPQPPMNPWAPAPAQAQVQPPWAQLSQEQEQPPMNAWAPDQNQARPQPPWVQPPSTQSPPQQNWQQPPPQQAPLQPPMNAWAPAQAQPQTHTSTWAPQPQQAPVNTQTWMHRVCQPSPKPWNAPQSAPCSTSPPPPQRMNSYTLGERSSSPVINPMASVLAPVGGMGSALSMPAVRGKGADLFAKRQSRMEKYVVDSDTVLAATAQAAQQAQAATAQANKARPTSPSPSVPHPWKYSPNCRAPPTSNYNPIQSPSYPPGAIKQPPPSSPVVKAKKGKGKPACKPLAVIDVMKHQPYQLNASLFTYGPAVEAAEAAKAAAPKPAPVPPNQNQPIRYEQAAPVQPAGQMNAPYSQQPQQLYGITPQPPMHDSPYHPASPNAYQPSNNPYQQVPAGPYQHPYNPPYKQAPPAPYQPQQQAQNPSYQHTPQGPYQPSHSPPYQAAPQAPYQPLPPSTYVVPSFPIAAKSESISGGSTAPKPRFMAKKSSAQAFGRSYSLSPPAARAPSLGLRSSSGSPSLSYKPRASSAPAPQGRQMSWLDKSYKHPSPWEAAARHPMGLVDEAFTFQNLQQAIAFNVCLAAQRKLLPEPPAEWKSRVSYHPPRMTEGWNPNQRWNQRQNQTQTQIYSRVMPPFLSPTKSTASAPAGPAGNRSLPRQLQPQRSLTEANIEHSGAGYGNGRPLRGQQQPSYRSVYHTDWSWRR